MKTTLTYSVICILVSLWGCNPALNEGNIFDPLTGLGSITGSSTVSGTGAIEISGPTAAVEGVGTDLSVRLTGGWPQDSLGSAVISFKTQVTTLVDGIQFAQDSTAMSFSPASLTVSWPSYTAAQTVTVTVNDLPIADQSYVITASISGFTSGTHALAVSDTDFTYSDISAGQAANSGYLPSMAIDAVNSKLLVVTQNLGNSNRTSLFRCNLDGTGCTHTDISAGQGANSGYEPSMAIDTVNSKLLVVTRNGANSSKPSLFRCDLDGTSCTHTDISVGQGSSSGNYPSMAIDTLNSKLLVATQNSANANKPSLFRCNLDGTGCTHTDISVGQPASSGGTPAVAIDTQGSKLLVVTKGSLAKPSVFRCNLDGTGCTHTDVSTVTTGCGGFCGSQSGNEPSIVVDTATSQVLIATENGANGSAPSLFRCNLAVTSCSHTDISRGKANSGKTPFVAIDTANQKILCATYNQSENGAAALFRCNMDGTACSFVSLGNGQAANSGYNPTMVIDAANGKILVVTRSESNSGGPSLLRLPLVYTQ